MDTMKNAKVFQSVFESAVEEKVLESEAVMNLYTLACDIDSLRQQVVDGARDAARDLVDMAERVRTGRVFTSNPSASSRLYDLPMNIATLEAKRQAFMSLAKAILPAEKFEVMKTAIVAKFTLLESDESSKACAVIYALSEVNVRES